MATTIKTTKQNEQFNQWAKQFNVSTLWDYDKFENREFLKRLDEARPIYEQKKQQHG
jgi:hypothetical protein